MTQTSLPTSDLPRLLVHHPDVSLPALPVVAGLPMRRGMLRDGTSATLTGPDGEPVPTQWRAMQHWPDGSVRWALVTARVSGGGEHHLIIDRAAPQGATPVACEQTQTGVAIDNGVLAVELGTTGPTPIRAIRLGDRAVAAGAEALTFVIDGQPVTDQGDASPRRLTVLEHNPLRARVRLESQLTLDTRLLDYRLDVELWAGDGTLRLDLHLINVTPDVPAIALDRFAVVMRPDLGGTVEHRLLQSHHGLYYVPRDVQHADPVAIVSDDTRYPAHVEQPEMLHDAFDYPDYLRPPLVNVAPWLGMIGSEACVFAGMRQFEDLRPKRLAARGGELTLDVWPSRAGTLDLPQGRSRRVQFALSFSDAGEDSPTAAQIASRLASPFAEGRAMPAPDWLRACGEFDLPGILRTGTHLRFEKYLATLTRFPLVSTFFDYGDTIDSGYSATYMPLSENNVTLRPGAPQMPRVFQSMPQPRRDRWQVA